MKRLLNFSALLLFILFGILVPKNSKSQDNKKTFSENWYEKISIRGYAQFRYNRLFETNDSLKCEQCDKSWGNGSFFIRRMRLVFYGNISDRIFLYIQPDFATSTSGTILNFGQLRDAYFDFSFDKNKEYRLRIGQSKIPYGFENLQSSQNRLSLDRSDALNSAISNERDLGAFFYWAPHKTRKLFNSLVNEGYKGSGDYGVLGVGVFNGQTSNKSDLNKNLHVVSRISYPFSINGQTVEASVQAYRGKYVLENKSEKTKVNNDLNYLDQRMAASFILYPKPLGLQAEYNIGKGPEFNKFTDSIETKELKGGYVLVNYFIKYKNQLIIPFIKYNYYKGGKKHELDARSYLVKELDIAAEWQPVKNFELVVMYTMSERRFEDYKMQNNLQKGNLMRIQAQFNF